jgi:predicted YcjX-like family ATPase
MIENTIAQIEARLRESNSLDARTREELAELLTALKKEITNLARTDEETARKIAGHTERSTVEAMREQRDLTTLQSSRDSLAASVEGFETSHPGLVQIVNRICTTFSNLGM